MTLSAPSTQAVTVDYTTADGTATTAGSDYTAASGTLTIPIGQTTGTITIKVRGDKNVEPVGSCGNEYENRQVRRPA